ncbi:ceramide-1-phosphate transfer protein-like [Mya arenaria]|nr:ceramide-1-phosphate transfer protein-like [Mya arenaria]
MATTTRSNMAYRNKSTHNVHVNTNENPTQHEQNNKDLSHEHSRPFGDEKHDFDLVLVLDSLIRCPLEGGDVDLSEYLVAYRELCRFFKLTGRLFGFVAKDLEGKLAIIEQKMDDKLLSTHCTTVKTMVCYEQEHSITFKKGYKPSGSRTLLRLHWALEFILEFMKKLSTSSDHDKTSLIASEVYHKTLSHHHPWITRKMAALAMYLLPTRKDLIGAMCKQDYDQVIELLDEVVQAGKLVYDSIQDIFAYNNILNIP